MDAIFYNEGRIRPVVAVVKSLASALAIGSGSAVGREGPIIQIGASLGSSLGGLLRLQVWQRITLVAAGAGAGIAATFNTPIGGVHLRHRTDDAGSQHPHLPAGCAGNRHRHLHRPHLFRTAARLPCAAGRHALQTIPPASICWCLYAVLGRADRDLARPASSAACITPRSSSTGSATPICAMPSAWASSA